LFNFKATYCLISLTICLHCATRCNGQANNYWYFPIKNAIKFDNYPPTIINNSQLVLGNWNGGEGCGTMTDNNGNLLYYNNGDSVWNRNNVAMPNGFDLCTAATSGYSSLSIPFVNDTNRYYIFQSAGYFATAVPPNFYNLNVVNMSLNGGLGDVEIKNDVLYYGSSDRLTATKASNGIDYWLITHVQLGNTWKVFKINCSGVDRNNPVLSSIGSVLNSFDYFTDYPTLKISADGKLLATNFVDRGYIELYQFNNATGVIGNPIKIIGEQIRTRTFEFSPDSKQLYLFSDNPLPSLLGALNQYDVSVYDSTIISNSRVSIAQGINFLYTSGQMQTAIDNRIYISTLDNYLHIIEKPNIRGIGCNFLLNGLPITNQSWSLPYSVPSTTTAQNVQISYIVAPDCRTVTFTGKTYIKGNNLTFKWKWGEPPPVAGTPLDSATQVVASMGDTTYTTIVHTYPPGQDTFFVNLTVTSDTLCGTGRAGIKVVVKPPKPTANFGFAAACNNLTVAFTDSSLLNSNPSITYQYAWKPALAPPAAYTNYSTLPNHSFTFAAYDSFDVRLIVTSALGCVPKDTVVKRIVLKAKPVAGCSALITCGSLQVNFTSSATVTPGTLTQQEYYVGNTLIGTGASFVYSFAAYGNYTVKQVVKSNFNCISDTFLLPVIIKDKPQVSILTARDSVCNNSSYTITANATVNASTITSYVWLKDNVVLANNASTLTDANPTGIYTYKLVATSAEGCPSDTAVKTITVVSKPTATINAVNNCGSKSIAITASGLVINDAITNHYINYGDGNISFADPNNTTYTYANYGTYNLKYVAKSSVGCESDTAYTTIVVKDKPVVSLVTPRDSVCNNSSYTITANTTVNATTISSYVWLKNNVVLANNTNTITETNPTGIYTYKLVATSAQGCPSDTAVKTITVVSKPTSGLNAVNNCGSKQISITSTAAVINDNITNHFISYGDGNTSNGNPNNTSYSYASYGTYIIKYVVQSSIGCASDTTYQTIDVKDKPVVSISYGNNACTNTNYVLTGNASVNAASISSYRWFKNGVLLPFNSSTLTENNPAGSYTYKLVVSSSQSCISDTAVQLVLVDNKPTATFTAGSTCVGKPVSIANNSIPNNPTVTYLWNTSDGQTSNAAVPSFVFNSSGTKSILLKVISPNGSCVANTSQTITVDAYPIAAFDIVEACLGKPLQINNNSTGTIASYAWQTSNAQQSSSMVPTFIFDTAGNYSIKLDVATANNCSATFTKSTSIQPVQLVVRPAVDTNVNVNQPVQLSISGAATYSWLPFNNLSNAGSSNPIFRSAVTGIFPLTVNATTAQGCKATATLTIKVFSAGEYLFIPNAFTPDGNGLNDKFNFTCSGLQSLTFFRVYNRYGQTVYQQNNCNNIGWDGTFSSKAQTAGAYVYYWQGVAFNGQTVSGNGTVLLVR